NAGEFFAASGPLDTATTKALIELVPGRQVLAAFTAVPPADRAGVAGSLAQLLTSPDEDVKLAALRSLANLQFLDQRLLDAIEATRFQRYLHVVESIEATLLAQASSAPAPIKSRATSAARRLYSKISSTSDAMETFRNSPLAMAHAQLAVLLPE